MQINSQPAVELVDVTRRFGEIAAVANVSLRIEPGEFFSLLGPSGCGKTTLLRIVAGLERPDSGSVRICGKDAIGIPAYRRPVNTVFQSYALFPHLNVRENIEFGLRMKKVPKPDLDRRTREAMDLVEISDLAQRMPAQLSGGQKQRVALARAVINEPDVLLLDEPLGALDLKLRKQLQVELRSLQRRLKITFIHVTHDQEEALAMSDRIAVMNCGQIEQIGTPHDIYNDPRTRFVAQFLGACNLIDGTVGQIDRAHMTVTTALGSIKVALVPSKPRPTAGHSVSLAIRPEKIRITELAVPSEPNVIAIHPTGSVYSGSATHYEFETAAGIITASRLNSDQPCHAVAANQITGIQFPPESFVVLEGS